MTYIQTTDPEMTRAIAQILGTYGDTVSVNEKNKSLLKFGRNDDIGTTAETVWLTGGHETLPTGNNIDIVTSTSASDTGDVLIEGHTISGSDLTFVSQTVTLTGTGNTSLTTPLYRASRMVNMGSADFVGTVTVEDNGTSTHITCPPAVNQSQKCATSLSSQDYWIITGISVGVDKTQTRSVTFELQVKPFGGVWLTQVMVETSAAGSVQQDGKPYFIVPKNADFRIRATSSGTTTAVSAWVNGHLALVI